ncbi:NADH pyrophosphatase [Aquicella siphonis]|uniref:NAD(+) diphosphatase n=1 Tax=Aquicella siphonis TaxID=254247 RepID=A0A5E4PM25_9COXI|nr:NAD(+) diphosphatase [Aquicella siphonis]VVC77266.1 NADH pyrophosphatase [Aquicella siphonis]
MRSSLPDIPEYWFIFQNDRLLLMKNSVPARFPDLHWLSRFKPDFLRQYKLGIFNTIDCFCAELDARAALPDEVEPVPLRKAFEILGNDWYAAAAKAYSVINWDKNHQYCGRCGHATRHKPGTFERVCDTCGLSLYPRISPSIIVLIQKDDKILMSRSPHFPPGAFGLIAGFVEVGESIEDAVHREVKEKVDIQIKNLRYFGSQSWPFPDSLMIGFTAEYASGDIHIDRQEIEAADWYRYDNLPGRPSSSISIAKKLIDYFIAKQSQSS